MPLKWPGVDTLAAPEQQLMTLNARKGLYSFPLSLEEQLGSI